MEELTLLVIGPGILGLVEGYLVFFALKRLSSNPGLWFRLITGILAAGVAALSMVLVSGHIAAQQEGHRGDGSLFVSALVYVFGTPVAAVAAFIAGLGLGQKPAIARSE